MHNNEDFEEIYWKKNCIFEFLNIDFDAIRLQILGKEELPPLNETISIIQAEEGRRSVMLESHKGSNSVLLTKAVSVKESDTIVSKDSNQSNV
jgi:hypothetical protein